MKSLRMVLRKNVKQIRRQKEITQEELSDRASIDYKYLQRIEGRNPPNLKLDTIEKLVSCYINSFTFV